MAQPVYLLDSNFNPVELIDEYVSFIWAERYAEAGDFQLQMVPDTRWMNLLTEDKYIGIPQSDEVMIIEGTNVKTQNGEKLFTVIGRTLSSWLETRSIRASPVFTDAPAGYVVQYIVRWGFGFGGNDDLVDEPRLQYGGYPGTPLIDYAMKDGEVYQLVKELCDAHDFGFRILPTGSSNNVRFDVLGGTDRPNMIFSTKNDTLMDPGFNQSTKGWKNCARVLYKLSGATQNSVLYVFADGYNPKGFGLKLIDVNATDIDSSQMELGKYLSMVQQRGRQELGQHKKVRMFEGAVPKDTDLKYRRDYFMGDTGYIKGDSNVMSQKVRVTEYIYSSDRQNGDQDYPTFSTVD